VNFPPFEHDTIACLSFSVPMHLSIDATLVRSIGISGRPEILSLTVEGFGHLNGTFYETNNLWWLDPALVRRFTQPALTISIETVPEPSTWLLMMTGLVIFICQHKYRAHGKHSMTGIWGRLHLLNGGGNLDSDGLIEVSSWRR
jgi:hypothetical protein